ncbi:helix-turn-helix domain-containing protein (plasmid) [Cyanobacterium aponinum AL20118]|uniref:Helix-turn-helix domain-containing protein n=1 Tax=Cyanobacterium aponinum AL20115 TaxID=3090662 RepID=A0AAF1C6A9_9CHRO|nr:helix-turn-helix domain-containing protein [Cyanobacterium aponinum]WPF90491.1 helix-turn-helix domain-containing protein [Cyanobacterium aponinum AL20115]
MYDDDENIEFQYKDEDFTPEGKLIKLPLPDFEPKYDQDGYLINRDEAKPYYKAREKNELLVKFTEYQHKEKLWENYGRLSPIQQKVLTLLVTGHNINHIATECNIERSTIYRWLQLDIFTKTLKLWQKTLLIEADSKINRVINKALEKLEFVLDNPQKFDSKDYLKAIEISLGFLTRGISK